ncbi:MAG: response regulator [Desulfomonilaceae bacterium]
MNPSVILVETGKEHPPEVTRVLEANGFKVLPCRSIFDLEKLCHEDDLGVVIVDLDDPLMNNRLLREVKRKHPALHIIGISSHLFHPDLKEAIASHIYACLCEPVDPEQLIYLVKGILCTATSSK